MEQITWTEDFSVGVERLDEQYKRIIQMINKLIAEPQTTTRSEAVSDLLNDMTKYAREHFETEEELMRQHSYPHLVEHVAQHRDYQKKTVDLCTATTLSVGIVPDAMNAPLPIRMVD
jgi:hemerythrin